MNLKSKHNLTIIKYKSLELLRTHQLPYKLVFYIQHITPVTPDHIVKYLLDSSEHLLRVKGYYKKYPQIEKELNRTIEREMASLLSINAVN